MPDLASITLPDNNTYDFKDTVARGYLNILDVTATYDSGVYKITSPIRSFLMYTNRLLRYKFLCLNIQLNTNPSVCIRLIASGYSLNADKIIFVGYGPNVDSDGELCRYSVVIDEDTDSTTELVINIEKVTAASDNIPASASIDNSGLITYSNSNNVGLFTLQLPLYNGGVS